MADLAQDANPALNARYSDSAADLIRQANDELRMAGAEIECSLPDRSEIMVFLVRRQLRKTQRAIRTLLHARAPGEADTLLAALPDPYV